MFMILLSPGVFAVRKKNCTAPKLYSLAPHHTAPQRKIVAPHCEHPWLSHSKWLIKYFILDFRRSFRKVNKIENKNKPINLKKKKKQGQFIVNINYRIFFWVHNTWREWISILLTDSVHFKQVSQFEPARHDYQVKKCHSCHVPLQFCHKIVFFFLRVNVRTIQSGAEQGSVDLADSHIYCSVFHADSRGVIRFS